MSATPRDSRREERARQAQKWAAWLKQALDDAQMTAALLVAKSGGALSDDKVSHWTQADNTASSDGALAVARILGRDPVEALRAASQDKLADSLARSIAEARALGRSEREAELRAELAGYDAELDARLARYRQPQQDEQPDEPRNGAGAC